MSNELKWDYPKKLNFDKVFTPKANDWFFILTTGRTGSTILTKMLNLHQDVHCANEQNIPHLFSVLFNSERIYYDNSEKDFPKLRFKRRNYIPLDTIGLRILLNAWRNTQTSKKVFGDKDRLYGEKVYSEIIDSVLPGHKIILSTRNILDQLSSLYQQEWYTKLPVDSDKIFKHILADVKYRLAYNKKWLKKADITIRFEDFIDDNAIEEKLLSIFKILNLETDKKCIKSMIDLSTHKSSFGRWKNDALMSRFIHDLEKEDPHLANKLKTQ